MYDVLISGSGPSGSKCAEILARSGYKVALIEKDTTWRKPCGGGCSVRLLKYYPQLKKLNLINKHTIVMYSADYSNFQYTYKNYPEYPFVIDRLELDNLIRNVAIDAGSELFDKNVSFEFILKNRQRVGIRTRTRSGIKEYYGKIIIVADGMSSKLALKSGIRPSWNINELGLAKCAILEGSSNLDVNTVYFCFQSYFGYGWIFPIDESRINIGVITFYEDNSRFNVNNLYKKFINEPEIKKLLSAVKYKQIWLAAFPEPANGVLDESLYTDNVMLVGDTAGFASPLSGEGLHASIVSGNAAAETAVTALEAEDYTEKTLKNYRSNPNIKRIIRNYKLKRSVASFIYGEKGRNLNVTFKLAEKDPAFKKIVVDTFLFNKIPPKDFFQKIKSFNS